MQVRSVCVTCHPKICQWLPVCQGKVPGPLWGHRPFLGVPPTALLSPLLLPRLGRTGLSAPSCPRAFSHPCPLQSILLPPSLSGLPLFILAQMAPPQRSLFSFLQIGPGHLHPVCAQPGFMFTFLGDGLVAVSHQEAGVG